MNCKESTLITISFKTKFVSNYNTFVTKVSCNLCQEEDIGKIAEMDFF